MATKTLITRIKNKVDTYANWEGTTGLLDGEIAIVRVTTEEVTPAGDVVKVPALLMKVGQADSDGNPIPFNNLPWLSAKASDVYDWAKKGAATEIPVTVNGTASTLGAYLTKVDTNAAGVASNLAEINKLKGSDTTIGSVAKAIKDAIAALDANTEQGTGNFVKAVAQADGKITVTKGNIAESDLPNISAAKITVTPASGNVAAVMLNTKLATIDSDITDLKARQTGHTDTEINTLIENKINDLDFSAPSASGTGTAFITSVSQTNGKISATKANLPAASSSTAGIVKLGATGGAATYDSIFGTGGINEQVAANAADISDLKTSVAGGVHFRGTVSAEPSATTTTVGNITIAAGDVVIYSGKEYICTAVTDGKPSWEQLGDVTRIGDLETKVNNLDYAGGSFGTSKFATKVTQTDGKIDVAYAQPTSADISHGTDTVSAKFEAVDAAITAKADGVHTHGNITNSGTITSTAVTAATGVLVYDTSNKIQRATAASARSIIGAAESGHNHDTRYVRFDTDAQGLTDAQKTNARTNIGAAASGHTHSGYESDITEIKNNYVKVTGDQMYLGNDVIIFDCGGAEDL